MSASSHARRIPRFALALALGFAGAVAAPIPFAPGPFAPAAAQEAGAEASAGIRGVIEGQLEAFLAGDVDAAWGYASPGIQRLFGSVETFGRMVREGYPMVWRPSEWRFLELAPEATPGGPRLRQSVMLRDGSGAVWIADYFMTVVDGAWRIDGVALRKPEATGV